MKKATNPVTGPVNGPGQYAKRVGQHLPPWVDRLKIHMESRAMSQADLARLANETAVRVNQFITGFCVAPVGPKLDAICKALKLEGTELDAFKEEAYLANSPPELRELVRKLRRAANK